MYMTYLELCSTTVVILTVNVGRSSCYGTVPREAIIAVVKCTHNTTSSCCHLRNAVLTDEAMKKISEFYLELRAHSEELRMPITVRTLEGIIRLCTASAKLRMSQEGITKVT